MLKPSTRAMIDQRKPINAGGERRDGLIASRTIRAMWADTLKSSYDSYLVFHAVHDAANRHMKARRKRAAKLRLERRA